MVGFRNLPFVSPLLIIKFKNKNKDTRVRLNMRIKIAQKTNLTSCHILLLILMIFAFRNEAETINTSSVVAKHGNLSVVNGKIVDQQQNLVSFAGPSLFWSWNKKEGERYYNAQSVNAFVDDWDATIIRAAMAAQGPGSYIDSPEDNRKKVEAVVDAAIAKGIYVIIDWHSHQAEQHSKQAIEFFSEMAKKYGETPNVIYEIYNEPLKNTDWDTVIKPYAEQVIAAIRAIDPDNLIVVGTQTWSQDVDKAADNPIVGFKNLAYTLHFYAGTHKQALRDKAQYAINKGLALFVTEWGTVDANGDGEIANESVQQWLAFMEKNSLSHCSWSVTNKAEGSAILKPNTQSLGPWQKHELTKNGIYLKQIIQQWNN